MQKSIFLIADNLTGKCISEYLLHNKNEDIKYNILTLGFPSIQLKHTSIFNSIDIDYEFYDIRPIKDKARILAIDYCLKLKNKYSKFVNNKKNIFSYNGISSWWFTAFSEMGTLRFDLVEKIYYLSLIRLIIPNTNNYDKILLDIKDNDLLIIIKKYFTNQNIDFKYVRHNFITLNNIRNNLFILLLLLVRLKFIARQLLKTIYFRCFRIGFLPQSCNKRVLFFSFYPALWKKNELGHYEFSIFKSVMNSSKDILKAHHLIFSTNIRSILFHSMRDRKIFIKQRIIFLERYLTVNDIISLINIRLIKIIINDLAEIRNKCKDSFYEFDVSTIIYNAIKQSILMEEYHQDLLLYKSINNLLNQTDIHGIVHASEFQCHEKAIWYACQGRCKCYAVQHSAIGKNWTNYYFNQGDIVEFIAKDGEIRMPFPDYYITAGRYAYRVMIDNGIEKDRLKLIGAIRYDSIAKYQDHSKEECPKKILKYREQKFIILLFGSSDRSESLDMILSVLMMLDNEYVCLFKSHPLNILDSEVESLFKNANHYEKLILIPKNENYYLYNIFSNVVIFCNSTIGIESIVLGVPAISFETYNSIKKYDLIEVGDSIYIAENSNDIKNSILSIKKQDSLLKRKMNSWDDAIADTFYLIDGNSGMRLIDLINNNIMFHASEQNSKNTIN